MAEVVGEEALRPFISVLDEYEQSFTERSVEKFRSLHVGDEGVVFFDNHASCDSQSYGEYEAKIAQFFEGADIGKLIRDNVRVFSTGDMVCITAMLRYSSKPFPGVRTTIVLERSNKSWKIRHIHILSTQTS